MFDSTPAEQVTRNRPFNATRFALATAVAAVLNLAVYAIGRAADAAMVVTAGNATAISAPLVIVMSLVPLAIAGLAAWFISGRWRWFDRTKHWIGLAFALVSIPSPLLSAEDTATGVSLAAMHVIAGLAWFIGARRQER